MMLRLASIPGLQDVFQGDIQARRFGHLVSTTQHYFSYSKELKDYTNKVVAKRPSKEKAEAKKIPKPSITTDSNSFVRAARSSQSRNDAEKSHLDSKAMGLEAVEENGKDAYVRTSSQPMLQAQRDSILKACVATCGGLSGAGLLIRQVSHWAAEAGLPVPDSTMLLPYDMEPWQWGVTLGLVVSVSTSRQLLLQLWPEFAQSSEVANQQILGPLNLWDYFVVASLPGISEELFFRGALLPIFGVDWKGATVVGVLFGVLHLSGGRKAAFAIWASFVGILYGLACVSTCTILVPIIAHSVNNLVGALLWKFNEAE